MKYSKGYFYGTHREYREDSNDLMGYCLARGEQMSPVEPDARRYECDSCGEDKVFGVEELLIMGKLVLR